MTVTEQLRALATETRNFPNPEHGDSEIFRRLAAFKESRAKLYDDAAEAIERSVAEVERLREALRAPTAKLEDEDAAYFVVQDWPEFIAARSALPEGPTQNSSVLSGRSPPSDEH